MNGKDPTWDFANVLFAGPCNRFCPFCIGKEIPGRVNQENLDLFPLRNQDEFVNRIRDLVIPEVVFTGTTTDPQLYKHEEQLLLLLKEQLSGGESPVRFSVHTNGVLALQKIRVFNQYNRACISFPSFSPDIYEKMMGSRRVPDLAAIVRESEIPVKVSCIVNEHNFRDTDRFLDLAADAGIKRIVFRKLFGEARNFPILEDRAVESYYRENPVYRINGLEVTVWDFDRSTSKSINLFPDGTIGSSYLLARTPEFTRV
ncbi:MAG: radical SAM protein [Leptospirales bacterium]|nr:radical SAM protein [Leptospirales bacterium]